MERNKTTAERFESLYAVAIDDVRKWTEISQALMESGEASVIDFLGYWPYRRFVELFATGIDLPPVPPQSSKKKLAWALWDAILLDEGAKSRSSATLPIEARDPYDDPATIYKAAVDALLRALRNVDVYPLLSDAAFTQPYHDSATGGTMWHILGANVVKLRHLNEQVDILNAFGNQTMERNVYLRTYLSHPRWLGQAANVRSVYKTMYDTVAPFQVYNASTRRGLEDSEQLSDSNETFRFESDSVRKAKSSSSIPLSQPPMRPIVIGVVAGLAVFCLNILPGVIAFCIGVVVTVGAKVFSADFNLERVLRDLVDKVSPVLLPNGVVVSRALAHSSRPRTVHEVQRTLRGAGLENCSLIVGLDFTKSNVEQGFLTYNKRSLHDIDSFRAEGRLNPYQAVITALGETLAVFDDDGMIPGFYFGDKETRDHSVKPLAPTLAKGFGELLEQYATAVKQVKMDGPTSFAPLIRRACELVADADYEFHILVIITDGAVNDRNDETRQAIVDASDYPLAIIAVGVGDGPWDEMHAFDDDLPERKFDNFTFVNYEEIRRKYDGSDVVFAELALRETPEQYKFARTNRYLGMRKNDRSGRARRSNRKLVDTVYA